MPLLRLSTAQHFQMTLSLTTLLAVALAAGMASAGKRRMRCYLVAGGTTGTPAYLHNGDKNLREWRTSAGSYIWFTPTCGKAHRKMPGKCWRTRPSDVVDKKNLPTYCKALGAPDKINLWFNGKADCKVSMHYTACETVLESLLNWHHYTFACKLNFAQSI